jgi:PAS domain S-box-containing protein
MKRAGTGEAAFPALRSLPDYAPYALELVIIAAGYFGVAELALLLPSISPTPTPVWPPTGLVLAVMLLRGYRVWPALLLGSFAASAMLYPLVAAGFVAVGTVGAASAGAWLINRWSAGCKTFETPFGIAKFALIAFVPTALLASSVALGGSIFAGDVAVADRALWTTWATWLLTDAAGTMVLTPVIVLWATTPLQPLAKWTLLETSAIFLVAAAIGFVAYSPLFDSQISAIQPYHSLLGFLILLPLMWAGLLSNQRNAATTALIFCAIAAWSFATGNSPFQRMDPNGSLLFLSALTISMSLAALILSTATTMHHDTETHLRTARDQAQRELVEMKVELESSKRHFQILIEGVADYAIFVLDTAGRVASWNSGAQRIIGYSRDEIIGKHFAMFYRPDERRAGEPNRALEMTVQQEKIEVEGWRVRKNGTPFFITGSISSIRDGNGTLVGFANIYRDSTERRDTQQKLVQAREQLAMAQKMEAMGKLTGGIAHDFNNLLMIIGGNAQTFKRLLDPKLPRAIEAIQTAAKRGESLTRQLLTFARRQHLTPTVVDLGTCIKNMRTMIESSLRGNIVYNERIDPGAWPVEVDLAELELAIVNIAVNARDAMPNGGTFSLVIGNVMANHDGDLPGSEFVAIEFSDTGMGIPPDLLSKIFDPFFTTKEVGKGTGLGLSQVYGFAHQSGGMVTADSKVGHGTTVTVYLPSSAGNEITDKDITEIDDVNAHRPAVLIVDDSAEVAEVTSSLFEDLGYRTIYRESAEEALKLLADGTKIDLVFSDIVMPGTIDGVGLAGEIRTQYPHLPVILTTGYSDAAQAAPSELRILRKPFDTDALRGFLSETIDANYFARQ